MIGSNHVNVKRGKAIRQAIVSDLWFSVDKPQATEAQSIGITKPDFITVYGSGFHNFVLQQAIGGREVQPILAVKTRDAAPANRPHDTIGAGSEATDAALNFRRQRHIHELKGPLRRPDGLQILMVGDPNAAVRADVNAGRNGLGSLDFFGSE